MHREADRIVLAKFAPPGMVIADDLTVVQFRGKTSPYLEPAQGTPSFDLMRLVREELRLPVRQAVDEARSLQSVARRAGLRLTGDGAGRSVDVDVMPLPAPPGQLRFFVVLFRDVLAAADPAVKRGPTAASPPEEPVVEQLRQELASTRDYLESVIEQLKARNDDLALANEDSTSDNEELRSTNEELQTAKAEIQAANEELRTLNDELAVRNIEATRLGDDLTNVFSSLAIPLVLLGRDSRILRFAPASARVLGLETGDIGRLLGEIPRCLATAAAEMSAEVLSCLGTVERTLQDESGRWYQLNARPYLTLDSRIDGTVIAMLDVDAITRATDRLAEAERERAQQALERTEGEFRDVLTTAAEGILMTDAQGHIIFANPALTTLFGYADGELLGKSIELLVPERLRARHADHRWAYLQAPAPRRMGGDGELVGRRKDGTEVSIELTLSPMTREHARIVVCFVTDVTARRETENRIIDYQERLRQMAFDAAIGEERERRRIAADLHDRIGQSLALAQMKLESIQSSGDGHGAVEETIQLLAQTIADTRTLIFDLSPPILYELGLKDALSWLAEDLGKRWGLQIELSDDAFTEPLGDATAAVLFRAVRELLTNVLKHAGAPAAKLSLRRAGDQVEIDVEDQGVGFDPQAAPASPRGGFGLFSVREQINRLGGTIEVVSGEQLGTRVSLRLPLQVPA